ncbi:MAG: hypothetical protein MUF78_10160 [Candidatus Edwardsbacteria bacterium]|nr:hypothetical protein [Candidatus Edwardsbacteria bacterium]
MRTLLLAALACAGLLAGCSDPPPVGPPVQPDTTTVYPAFGGEREVVITGYGGHAMEPFISGDGQALFFNSLNDGDSTSLYYATRVSDTSFACQGEVGGVNGTPPHLDAVASMDGSGRFYFVSTRDWPGVLENIQAGDYAGGAVTGVAPVTGDFYVSSPGWLVMDAEIGRGGDLLYYCNARFSGGAIPEEARLGVARRQGASFAKLAASDTLLGAINDTSYLVYAPASTADGRELYVTRMHKRMASTRICVSVRTDTARPFSAPRMLEISGSLVEAPTITADKRRIYYHKLAGDGKYHVYTMTRQ